jgi:CBS domain-containing protein
MSEQVCVTREPIAAAAYDGLRQTIEFLRRHEPFNRMAWHQLEYLAKHLRLSFYAKGTAVIEPGHGVGQTLYIVKQGRVQGEAAGCAPPASELRALMPGDCFPIGPLLARRPITFRHRAVENTFCYALDSHHFEHLLAQKAAFYQFCARRVCSLLQEAIQGMPISGKSTPGLKRSLSTRGVTARPPPCGGRV